MEESPNRGSWAVWDNDWPQEPHVLQRTAKANVETGKLDDKVTRLRLCDQTPWWDSQSMGRHIVKTWGSGKRRTENSDPLTRCLLREDAYFVRMMIGWIEEETEPEYSEAEKAEKIKLSHDIPTAGHPGVKRTLDLLFRRSTSGEGSEEM
jgi:hypothetical protein